MELIVATKNKGKVKEIKKILEGFNILTQGDIGIFDEIIEDGTTFSENALIKARAICHLSNKVTIADDSGLMVSALGGAPGVYSARYAGENASDEDRNNKLLREMKGFTDRQAKYVCAIAICYPNGEEFVFTGECEGTITEFPVGNGGFGYDPLFYIKEYDKTFGLLSDDIKNKISHRSKALNNLKEHIIKKNN